MYRTEKLVVRLNEAERAAIGRLAQKERLPVSTLTRQMLLREVDRRGLWLPNGQNGSPVRRRRSTEKRMEVLHNG